MIIDIMHKCVIMLFIFSPFVCSAQEKPGADIPWKTYEAENMHTDGLVLGPEYKPYNVATESSQQKCVKLGHGNQYIEFAATENANTIVIRYSLPDSKNGKGETGTLNLYLNGKFIRHDKISSHFSWLYGKYPFTNDPGAGSARNFYDESRLKDITISKGDVIKIQLSEPRTGEADYCIIDLVDLEKVAPPLNQPLNSLSVADKRFIVNVVNEDYTDAFRACIRTALNAGKSVWIPPGTFKITGDISLPANLTIQGAGMWYSTLEGDQSLYSDVNKRVRLKGNGGNIHLSDFAIIGKLNYRNDNESNDGIVGTFGTNSSISNIWIEHTKVGIWVENSQHLKIGGCRLRNTIADGINFCVGMYQSTIQNCTARGTGDDCFAIWPTTFMKQEYNPGENLINHCTGQLPFLANGVAIYGGKSNKVSFCSFTGISQGSAILISTTFPTEDKTKNTNNNFSGTTIVENCNVNTSGGFDHEWGWRAAVQICLDKRSISGIEFDHLDVENSLSDGISIIAKSTDDSPVVLSNATFKNIRITNYGIGFKDTHGLWIAKNVYGSLTLIKPAISEIKNDSKHFVIR